MTALIENVAYDIEISAYLEERLLNFFQWRDSFVGDEHMTILDGIMQTIDTIYPGFTKRSNIVLKLRPNLKDAERNVLINLESETINFRKNPQDCIIIFPENVDGPLLNSFRDTISDDYHCIVAMARSAETLVKQYTFVREPDQKWLSEYKGIVTFFRFKLWNQKGEETIFIVPFVGREQINEFQNSLYDDLDVLGCASVFTLGDEGAWSDELLSYFLFDCKWYCYLNDASLLYCLEEYFIYKEPVTYCRIKLNIGDTIYVALLFSYYIVGYNQKMVILCSDAYITLWNHSSTFITKLIKETKIYPG